ncbi:hypothetical protein TELCIR_19417 [Teladorsagia circumcincta]|uniref:Regulator of condensation n=1 Tax=Teladorsagia circumcincta TaxID=45464 RepID=A0A2G9TP79_TELCI|nr:hypothetical protein TELCIR_19417 [Teladorsagia circumcincta]
MSDLQEKCMELEKTQTTLLVLAHGPETMTLSTGSRYSTLERIPFPREAGKIAGTTAKLGCSVAWTEKGDAYAWGCDTSGQLGLGLKDDDEKPAGFVKAAT